MEANKRKMKATVESEKRASVVSANIFSYAICNTLTSPLSVLGISMQLSSTANLNFYEEESKAVSRLELAKSYDLAVREKRFNELQLSSGMTGTNRPFRAPIYRNYRETFLALSGQGYLAFYKGNGVNCLYCSLTTAGKVMMASRFTFIEDPVAQYITNFAFMVISECLMQPVHNAYTRFVLQNRIPEFTTYKSLYALVSKVKVPELLQGYRCILPMHFFSSFCVLNLINQDTYGKMILANSLGYAFVYPLDTVMKRLECQSLNHTMLPRRYLGIRDALSKIYHEEGIFRGLYRGLICNLLSATVKYTILPVSVIKMYEHLEYIRYKNHGWDL